LAQARRRLDADPKEKQRFLKQDFFKGDTSLRDELESLSATWFKLRPTVRRRIDAALQKCLDNDATLTAAAIGGATWLVARMLGVRGARVDRTVGDFTLLEWATRANEREVVQWLLAHGADPNRLGFNTVRPIHHAAMHNSIDAAKLLIAAGADASVGVPDWGDETAEQLARRRGFDELATLLARAAKKRTATRGSIALPRHLGEEPKSRRAEAPARRARK
jgi:ankyrin repeat protein